MAPARFASERDRLAARIAKQIWVAHGGRRWADARDEGVLLLLETMVARQLTDAIVQTSLALSYMELLENAASRADYEDAGTLAAELQWAETFLSPHLSPSEPGSNAPSCRHPGNTALRSARLHDVIAAQVSAELSHSGLAA